MERIMYHICQSRTLKGLENDVNRKLSEGWKLYGYMSKTTMTKERSVDVECDGYGKGGNFDTHIKETITEARQCLIKDSFGEMNPCMSKVFNGIKMTKTVYDILRRHQYQCKIYLIGNCESTIELPEHECHLCGEKLVMMTWEEPHYNCRADRTADNRYYRILCTGCGCRTKRSNWINQVILDWDNRSVYRYEDSLLNE